MRRGPGGSLAANMGCACAGNSHTQGSQRNPHCKYGLPRVQGFRENARCLSFGRSGRPLRGPAYARRVAPRRGPEGAHPAPDLGREPVEPEPVDRIAVDGAGSPTNNIVHHQMQDTIHIYALRKCNHESHTECKGRYWTSFATAARRKGRVI
jgi:hypothetical protein